MRNDIFEIPLPFKVSYQRDHTHNYMVIEETKGIHSINEDNLNILPQFELKMLECNKIPGLLNYEKLVKDGIYYSCYDISSMQPLYRLFENKEISCNYLISLIRGIFLSYESIYQYMLSDNHVLLNPKYIFINPETDEVRLLYTQLYDNSFDNSFLELSEYILDHVNHNDDKAVMIAYKLYKIVKNSNFTLKEIKSVLEENSYTEIADINQSGNEISQNESLDLPFPDDNKIDIQKENAGFLKRLENKLRKSRNSKIAESKESINLIPPEKPSVEKSSETPSIDDDSFDETIIGKTTCMYNATPSSNRTLTYILKGKTYTHELSSLPLTVGKLKNSVDLVINESSISRIHARFIQHEGHIYLEDCNSTNGTFVNGMQLEPEERLILEIGDEIRLGNFEMIYN